MIRRLLPIALVLSACPAPPTPDPAPAPPAAVITRFAASATQVVNPGDKVTLSWETTDAESVSLEQLERGPLTIDSAAPSGVLEVSIERDTLYALTARGKGGTDTKLVSVVLNRGGNVMLFAALPSEVLAGEPVNLVWNAPDAQNVSLRQVGGQAIDIGMQKETGSVRVFPGRSTSYELNVDGRTAVASVVVRPAIFEFAIQGESPLPGQPLTLVWRTGGGSRATLKRAGLAMPLTSVTGGLVANGTFTDTLPANLPIDGVVEYVLEIEAGAMKAQRTLTVTLGGAVRIDEFKVPPYVKPGGSYIVSWKTTGATRLELRVGGQLYFTASNATQLNGDSMVLQAPATTTTIELTVRNAMGSVARQMKQVNLVGVPVFNSFTTDAANVALGGTPVTLRWNVTNARSVRIIEQPGDREVFVATGVLDTGIATVYPNRPSLTYELRADNTVGDAIMPRTVAVTVTTPATLTFSKRLPLGLTTQLIGSTVPGGGAISGLPNVVRNAPGEQFVDIAQTGVHVVGTTTNMVVTPAVVTIPQFETRVWGQRITATSLSISPNGWLVFSAPVPNGPSAPAAPLGTDLVPLTIVPYGANLTRNTARESAILWQIDRVAGGLKRLIVQWENVEDDDAISRLTFQAQVYSNGKIVFAYKSFDGPVPTPVVGIVNKDETAELLADDVPNPGDTFTFFGQVQLPYDLVVDGDTIIANVDVGNLSIEVEGNPAILPGQFAITEVNPRPSTTLVRGEWLEITNFSNEPVDLDGWVLDFGGGATHTLVTPPILPPNGHLLLAQVPGAEDGLPVDYVYGAGYQLGDLVGEVRLSLEGGDYSAVSWDPSNALSAGRSVRFDPPNANAVYATGFMQLGCPSSTASTYGTNGQRGTPRASHAPCFPYQLSALPAGGFQSIAATGTSLPVSSSSSSSTALIVNLPRPIRYYGANVSTLYVSQHGYLTTVAPSSMTATNRVLPSVTASTPQGTIAPFWDSLTTSTGVGLYWQQLDPDGTPGNADDLTIVSWEGMRQGTTSQYNLNFQVHFKANGDIEYHYGTMSYTGTSTIPNHTGLSATSWLESREMVVALPINISTAGGIQPNTAYRYTYAP